MSTVASSKCTHDTSAGATKCIPCFRQNLPVYSFRQRILDAVVNNQFVIIEAETGSGKSTQIPQYLLESGYNGIICTQPRRIAAISLASRVAKEVNCQLGTTVGYKVRFDSLVSSETTLAYVSDGFFLRELTLNHHAQGYSVVIIDEAHQRSAASDILMGLLKKLCLTSRKNLKIVIMSATLDVERFLNYFTGANLIKIPGRLFPVDVIYSPACDVTSTVLRIHDSKDPGDVLIFLPGVREVTETCESLQAMLTSDDTIVLTLYSQLPAARQADIFKSTPPGYRKIICSTNIAETSLTIEGIVFIIDTGRARHIEYNTHLRIDVMVERQISKQEADQRKGRAGNVLSTLLGR